jgi:glycosyltransferase involved in cell wall biosynthesis
MNFPVVGRNRLDPAGPATEQETNQDMATKVSIVIATFYREEMLRRTLESCLAQRGFAPDAIEIVVVDNAPDGSARCVVEGLEEAAARRGMGLRYLREPRPGISYPRNAGVKAASADLVAFIDDDEEADPDWLHEMLSALRRYDADIVVGPVYPVFEQERAARDPFWRWYFTADSHQPSGEIAKRGAGTHNCLFVKRTCCHDDEPFDPALGLTGGEDFRFFLTVTQRGGRVVWCAEGIVREFVPASRSNWAYAVRRRLRENQLLLQSFLWSDPPRRLRVAIWMAIGLVQIVLFAPLSIVLFAFDSAAAKKCATKAVGGLGKLLWLPALTLIGYGSRTIARSEVEA